MATRKDRGSTTEASGPNRIKPMIYHASLRFAYHEERIQRLEIYSFDNSQKIKDDLFTQEYSSSAVLLQLADCAKHQHQARTIESWSCIKCTLVHIAKSNRKQRAGFLFSFQETTNPSDHRSSYSCKRTHRGCPNLSVDIMAIRNFSCPNCGFICLSRPYIKGVQLHAEITYGRSEFKQTGALLDKVLGGAQPTVCRI